MRRGNGRTRLALLRAFALDIDGEEHTLGATAARTMAFIALQDEPIDRRLAAGTLWPHVRDARAAANLRTTLWRISQVADPPVVEVIGGSLQIASHVPVDLIEATMLARRIVSRSCDVAEMAPAEVQDTIDLLNTDLLTNWYDDWLLVHRERWRQLRLHALDSVADRLTEAKRLALAVDASTAAVDAEPLRESGYRCLMRAHLAQGNISEVVRTHRRYCELLTRELGVGPSHHMTELLGKAVGT